MLRRFLSLFVAFIVLFCVSAPVFATGMEVGGGGGAGVGIPIVGNINLDLVDFADYWHRTKVGYGNTLWNLIDQDVCSHAPQFGGGHKFVPVRTMKDGQVGMYYQCEYCGRSYGDMIEEAYQDYVDELPGTSYNSDGGFLWYPKPVDFVPPDSWDGSIYCMWVESGTARYLQIPASGGPYPSPLSSKKYFFIVYPGEGVFFNSGLCGAIKARITWPSVRLPCDGYYTAVVDGVFSGNDASALRMVKHTLLLKDDVLPLGDSVYPQGITEYTFPWPTFWIIPTDLSTSAFVSDRVADVSVSASGDGMYGYIGSDGTLHQSSVGTIYNEETNIYQNPVTGDVSTVNSWVYNYPARQYILDTTDDSAVNGNVTLTYGDENITISEVNDGVITTYNVYYLAEEPEEVLSEPVHVHSYSSTVTTPPTCTGTGVKTYACACGESYTEVVPATGHSFGDFVITLEPTCTVAGLKTAVCSACGETLTQPVPALGHSFSEFVTTVEPTCTTAGLQTAVCSVCGETATQSIPAKGHSYSSEVTMEPTCTGTGVRTFTCSECGDTYSASISATGHKWRIIRQVPSVFDEDGQPLSEGYTLYQCDTCGEQYKVTAESDGAALPSPAPDGASTAGTELIEIDPSVGRGFLATIAHGVTEDLPEVLQLVSQWFTVIPSLHEGFNKFLQQELSFFPPEVLLLFSFSIGVTVVVGFCRFLFRR